MTPKGKLSPGQLKKKVADLENQCKRALADYLNLEKRVEKEKGSFVRLANASLIDKLLPVLDSLERCGQYLKDKGFKSTLEQLKRILENEGVEEIKAQGERFDPEAMDAVEIVSGPKDRVVEVTLKGYTLNGQVIRPAKVNVGRGKQKHE